MKKILKFFFTLLLVFSSFYIINIHFLQKTILKPYHTHLYIEKADGAAHVLEEIKREIALIQFVLPEKIKSINANETLKELFTEEWFYQQAELIEIEVWDYLLNKDKEIKLYFDLSEIKEQFGKILEKELNKMEEEKNLDLGIGKYALILSLKRTVPEKIELFEDVNQYDEKLEKIKTTYEYMNRGKEIATFVLIGSIVGVLLLKAKLEEKVSIYIDTLTQLSFGAFFFNFIEIFIDLESKKDIFFTRILIEVYRELKQEILMVALITALFALVLKGIERFLKGNR